MKSIEVNCKNRDASVIIYTDHIVMLKKLFVAGIPDKEVCEIILTSSNDNKGPVLVTKTVAEVKKLIKSAKE